MTGKYKGKYRNESARLKNWNYGWDGAYFITICTKDRQHFFGEITDSKMQVSPAGAIAHVLWHEIKNHVQNIELGEFIVMPNHIHGVLVLNGNNTAGAVGGMDDDGMDDDGMDVVCRDVACRDVACNVPTESESVESAESGMEPISNIKSNQNPEIQSTTERHNKLIGKNEYMATISPKSNSISTIIRSYKSAVTKYCNRLNLPCAWQPRFHDHIIRNEESFVKISEYIKNNPASWNEDKFYQ
jgi:REP element-mobilizing transposase RayT